MDQNLDPHFLVELDIDEMGLCAVRPATRSRMTLRMYGRKRVVGWCLLTASRSQDCYLAAALHHFPAWLLKGSRQPGHQFHADLIDLPWQGSIKKRKIQMCLNNRG